MVLLVELWFVAGGGTMAKDRLNGSAERFALALRDMVRDAAREAVEPLKADVATLKTDVAEIKTRRDGPQDGRGRISW